jgi:hypothetical protein
MADAQVPWSVGVLGGVVTDPAWRAKPSWYLVATEDRMIPPPAQPAPFWGLSTQTASDCSPRQISKPDKDALNSASPGVRRHTNPPVQARRNRSWTDQDAAHSVGTAHVADVESESLTVAASQEGTVPDRRFRAATMCVFAAGRVVQMILICVPPSASDDTALAEQNGGSAHLRPGG